jgi:hypothetical protein
MICARRSLDSSWSAIVAARFKRSAPLRLPIISISSGFEDSLAMAAANKLSVVGSMVVSSHPSAPSHSAIE